MMRSFLTVNHVLVGPQVVLDATYVRTHDEWPKHARSVSFFLPFGDVMDDYDFGPLIENLVLHIDGLYLMENERLGLVEVGAVGKPAIHVARLIWENLRPMIPTSDVVETHLDVGVVVSGMYDKKTGTKRLSVTVPGFAGAPAVLGAHEPPYSTIVEIKNERTGNDNVVLWFKNEKEPHKYDDIHDLYDVFAVKEGEADVKIFDWWTKNKERLGPQASVDPTMALTMMDALITNIARYYENGVKVVAVFHDDSHRYGSGELMIFDISPIN